MKHKICLLILLYCWTGCYKADNIGISTCNYSYTDTNLSNSKHQKYTDFLNRNLIKGYPGLALAVLDSTGNLWVDAVGYASLEAGIKMEKCHLHHSASVAKPYIATTILKLYEQGKIDLDAKAITYLPEEVPDIANLQTATVTQLLNHTAGIPDFDNNNLLYYINNINSPLGNKSWLDVLNKYVKDKEAPFPAGTDYQYSNTHYTLLGLIIEQVSGQSLGDAVQDLILSPAQLSETYYKSALNYPNVANVVESYLFHYDHSIQNCSKQQQHFSDISMGNEGIIASPRDYVLFFSKLFNGEILSASTLAKGKEIEVLDDHSNCCGRQYSHAGGSLGTITYAIYRPETKTTIFYASNIGILGSLSGHFYKEMRDELLEIVNE